ncbi:phytosulfokine receptor 1 [Ceratobasidium sp. AG-Ba]|nr:phytosulfokine receptor 1 [Ceratobasidium sp. AG-Ba]
MVDRCKLLIGISRGVAYLHKNGAIHGDIKSGNVLVSREGIPKLADFGCTQLKKETLQFTTTTTSALSIRWAAPEVLSGNVVRSKEADVYALGMTLLETITGSVPFHEQSDVAVFGVVCFEKKTPQRPEDFATLNLTQANMLWKTLLDIWAYEALSRPNAREIRDRTGQMSLSAMPEPGPADQPGMILQVNAMVATTLRPQAQLLAPGLRTNSGGLRRYRDAEEAAMEAHVRALEEARKLTENEEDDEEDEKYEESMRHYVMSRFGRISQYYNDSGSESEMSSRDYEATTEDSTSSEKACYAPSQRSGLESGLKVTSLGQDDSCRNNHDAVDLYDESLENEPIDFDEILGPTPPLVASPLAKPFDGIVRGFNPVPSQQLCLKKSGSLECIETNVAFGGLKQRPSTSVPNQNQSRNSGRASTNSFHRTSKQQVRLSHAPRASSTRRRQSQHVTTQTGKTSIQTNSQDIPLTTLPDSQKGNVTLAHVNVFPTKPAPTAAPFHVYSSARVLEPRILPTRAPFLASLSSPFIHSPMPISAISAIPQLRAGSSSRASCLYANDIRPRVDSKSAFVAPPVIYTDPQVIAPKPQRTEEFLAAHINSRSTSRNQNKTRTKAEAFQVKYLQQRLNERGARLGLTPSFSSLKPEHSGSIRSGSSSAGAVVGSSSDEEDYKSN